MAEHDLALVNGHAVLPGGLVERVNIGVRDGKIATLTDTPIDADETLDVEGLTVLPGLVDEHFHVFRGYGWETYPGATRAAAKGGITTVVDMPLDKPPTLTAAALREKLTRSAASVTWTTQPSAATSRATRTRSRRWPPRAPSPSSSSPAASLRRACIPGVTAGQMLDAMRRIKTERRTVVVHSENAPIVDFETDRLKAEGRDDVAAWDEARPWFSELEAVQRVVALRRGFGLPHRDRARHRAPVGRRRRATRDAAARTSGSRPARTTSA